VNVGLRVPSTEMAADLPDDRGTRQQAVPDPPASTRPESADERADRNLNELLMELRVALPGVQVLFGFLLTVPFTIRFQSLSFQQEQLYLAALLSAAATTALLVTPTANHRLLFRKGDKEYLVVASNRLAVAGIAFMAVSMCSSIQLVTSVVFDSSTEVVITFGAAVGFAWLWFVRPLLRRRVLADEANGR